MNCFDYSTSTQRLSGSFNVPKVGLMKTVLQVGFIAAALHIVLYVATLLIVPLCNRSGATEICDVLNTPIGLLDFPVFLIFSSPLSDLLPEAFPVDVCFAMLGTLQWFVLGLSAGVVYRAKCKRPNQAMKPRPQNQ
jgi:hypothetical protein